MRSYIERINKVVRRWNTDLEYKFGFRLEPHLLVTLTTCVIIFILVIFLLLLRYNHATINQQHRHQKNICRNNDVQLPTIYAITPTYSRFVQKAELVRLSHTFLLVPNIHWIIVEDSDHKTSLVSTFIQDLKSKHQFDQITHLNEVTPPEFKIQPNQPSWIKPKGVWQRNKALKWLLDNKDTLNNQGIVYFADDDNTYDLELFNEMLSTKKVSVWPVAFAGGLLVERPIVNPNTGLVDSFNSMWKSQRPFPLDMAGFALSLELVLSKPLVGFSPNQEIGYLESHFLNQYISSWSELEPKANNCTKILVWHTKTQRPALHEEKKLDELRSSMFGMIP